MANDDPSVAAAPEPESPAATGPASLDFDKAAYAEPVASKTCAACKQLVPTEYYEAGGQIICGACRNQLVGANGDRWAFGRALLYGGLAAAAGSLVWGLIIHFTGYELGLIAILVGIGVGITVRKGSGGRGGWKYQTLAMALTYLSITTSYVPIVIKGLVAGARDGTGAAVGVRSDPKDLPAVADDKDVAPGKTATPAKAATEPPSLPLPIALLAFAAFVWAVALAAPFLAGTSNIMGLIIIAIGLYEAWKYNRALKVSGPFRLPPTLPASPAETGTP